ncbi:Pentatricopeptide repeat-containing protein MRL1, chloroplastic [Vitis vinifera]|uniref:Pentatricopeptide repeat-containing protein MRL1, chloroplastic n=1 Tax=Vitis vinifera TaxID=29760 RepID=A0A438I936_VITVI|nr:Pentatricopeptide repeat-containing protein MRL1, chloroplastic [Vitis vinifera]RVW93210.1 Pentatricopeptide repeat-containing protein MRL1, chloroplastic [Vitis vinifera]
MSEGDYLLMLVGFKNALVPFHVSYHNKEVAYSSIKSLMQMFLSALIDVAGHAGKLDAAFEVIQEARIQGIPLGIVSYSSLMGACSNLGTVQDQLNPAAHQAKNWQKALELYVDIKSMKLNPTVSTMNALITALCKSISLP